MLHSFARRRVVFIFATLLWLAVPVSAQVEPEDVDRDGVEDGIDSCPLVFNPDQEEACLAGPPLRSSREPASSSALIFYDVDFATPPHTIGLPPMVGLGPIPRDTPSAINFGAPIVVAAEGVMDQQPLRFGSGSGTTDQIRFGIADDGLDGGLPHYHFEMTVMMLSEGEVGIFFDGPMAHSVKFLSSGGNQIRAVTLGDGGYDVEIGRWEAGVERRLVVDIDRATAQWTIALDGEVVFSGPYSIPFGDMRMLRPSAHPDTVFVIDDVIVSDVAPPPAPVLGMELIGQRGFVGFCKNNATGDSVVTTFFGTTLDCSALGLTSSSGDPVTIWTIGAAETLTVGAAQHGHVGFLGVCKNNTTGDTVLKTGFGAMLDCATAQGPLASPGDSITIVTIGIAD